MLGPKGRTFSSWQKKKKKEWSDSREEVEEYTQRLFLTHCLHPTRRLPSPPSDETNPFFPAGQCNLDFFPGKVKKKIKHSNMLKKSIEFANVFAKSMLTQVPLTKSLASVDLNIQFLLNVVHSTIFHV